MQAHHSQDTPEDYVIAMGETTRVRDFVRMAFAELGIEIEFSGQGVDEKGFVASCSHPDYQLEIGKQVIAVDPKYFRPTEVDLLIGDATKAKNKLNWEAKVEIDELVRIMMEHDIKMVKHTKVLADEKRG